MATRGTILVTDTKIDYAHAKNSKTLLNKIANSKRCYYYTNILK